MIIIVVVVVLIVNNVVLINAKIPSESMENTIMTGDRIFGFRMAYGINFDFFGNHISKKLKDPRDMTLSSSNTRMMKASFLLKD